MENSIYTVDYFIKKFTAIPENEIGLDQESGCAYGQCRSQKVLGCQDGDSTPEGKALEMLMISLPNLTPTDDADFLPYQENSTPARINNGDVAQYQQPTPKARILAALEDIKKLQHTAPKAPEVKERIVYVMVDSTVKELSGQLTNN